MHISKYKDAMSNKHKQKKETFDVMVFSAMVIIPLNSDTHARIGICLLVSLKLNHGY